MEEEKFEVVEPKLRLKWVFPFILGVTFGYTFQNTLWNFLPPVIKRPCDKIDDVADELVGDLMDLIDPPGKCQNPPNFKWNGPNNPPPK